MPELPEVEVTRRSFCDRIAGASVHAVRLGAPLRWPLGVDEAQLVGTTVGEVRRRGKYLWLPLSRPQAPAASDAGGLLMHLGMSGSLWFGDPRHREAGRHDHFELHTSHGLLRLTDPRRFGAVVWSPGLAQGMAARLLAGLGHEPFDEGLTPELMHAALRRRRTTVKAALMAGDIVVGAGNIYACEALFEAGIHPHLRSDRLSAPRTARLLAAVRATLSHALALGGSTLRDFRDAHGMDGAFQSQARVYGREGQACLRCGTTIRRVQTAQRSTFFCPRCQKR